MSASLSAPISTDRNIGKNAKKNAVEIDSVSGCKSAFQRTQKWDAIGAASPKKPSKGWAENISKADDIVAIACRKPRNSHQNFVRFMQFHRKIGLSWVVLLIAMAKNSDKNRQKPSDSGLFGFDRWKTHLMPLPSLAAFALGRCKR